MKKPLTLALAAIMILSVMILPTSAAETDEITVTDTDIAEMKQLVVDAVDMASSFHTPFIWNCNHDPKQTIIGTLYYDWKVKEAELCLRTDKYARWSDTKAMMEKIFTGNALETFNLSLPIGVKDGSVYILYNPSQLIYRLEWHDDEVNCSLDDKFIIDPIDEDSVKVTFDYIEQVDAAIYVFENTAVFTKTSSGWRIEKSDFVDNLHAYRAYAPQTGVATVALAIMALVSGGYVVARKRRT